MAMGRMARMTRKRLGEILLDEGIISEDQLLTALGEQRTSGQLLGELLVELNYATEYDIAKAMVTQFAWPYISLKSYFLREEVAALVPAKICRQYHLIPMEQMGNVLAIVAGSALNADILREIERITGCQVRVYVGTYSEVKDAIDTYHGDGGYVPDASPLEGAVVQPLPAPAAAPAEAPAAAPETTTATAPAPAPAAEAPIAEAPAEVPAEAAAEEARPAAPEAAPAAKEDKSVEEQAAALDEELSSLGSMLLGDDE